MLRQVRWRDCTTVRPNTQSASDEQEYTNASCRNDGSRLDYSRTISRSVHCWVAFGDLFPIIQLQEEATL
jgi:hypothetical protein